MAFLLLNHYFSRCIFTITPPGNGESRRASSPIIQVCHHKHCSTTDAAHIQLLPPRKTQTHHEEDDRRLTNFLSAITTDMYFYTTAELALRVLSARGDPSYKD
ncbi:hypothetical protein BDQ12DRAFT_674138 [Crucibulum laeve]|uniref:Uncharacterized protein n=1 Tax=Crucibulum laeve TaxID=68775 RepID=A0A5C3MK86_9AGAR|nr:hypothetical protein BDQ12DRAFT_674138 [Crucibulum laeve]